MNLTPKLTVSTIITILTYGYSVLRDNADIFGINSNTLTAIFLIITFISFVWKQFDPQESVFTKVSKHIGTRPKKPRG